jgi:hypothetical protein
MAAQYSALAATIGTDGRKLFPIINTNISVNNDILTIADAETRETLRNYLLKINNIFAIFTPDGYSDAFDKVEIISNRIVSVRTGTTTEPGLINDFDRFLKIINQFTNYLVENGHFTRNDR